MDMNIGMLCKYIWWAYMCAMSTVHPQPVACISAMQTITSPTCMCACMYRHAFVYLQWHVYV